MDIVIVSNFGIGIDDRADSRFNYLANMLYEKGHNVEIITCDFFHGKKRYRTDFGVKLPYKITFLHQPAYKKNISIKRLFSHYCWGREVNKYLQTRKKPDVIYCAIPSLTAAAYSAKYCKQNKIRFIIDIQDLWPEAFMLAFHIPIISNIIFYPFNRLADYIYSSADSICAVSQTYVDRALLANKKLTRGTVAFLGKELKSFDIFASENIVEKPSDELWLGYCGSMSASYNLPAVIDALAMLEKPPKFIAMGDGEKRKQYEDYAKQKRINALFTGKLPFDKMCGWIVKCDIVINPITSKSAASVINKHADYAASGLPVINTQESPEYRKLVENRKMGFNCSNSPAEIAEKLRILIGNPELRKEKGKNARRCAEEMFDRQQSYKSLVQQIVD